MQITCETKTNLIRQTASHQQNTRVRIFCSSCNKPAAIAVQRCAKQQPHGMSVQQQRLFNMSPAILYYWMHQEHSINSCSLSFERSAQL
jgi:hypothetical protein